MIDAPPKCAGCGYLGKPCGCDLTRPPAPDLPPARPPARAPIDQFSAWNACQDLLSGLYDLLHRGWVAQRLMGEATTDQDRESYRGERNRRMADAAARWRTLSAAVDRLGESLDVGQA